MSFLQEYEKMKNEELASEAKNQREKNALLREIKATPIDVLVSQPKPIVTTKNGFIIWLKRLFNIK